MSEQKTESKFAKGILLTLMYSLLLFILFFLYLVFIGNPRPRGSDRAVCILNIRNIHQAVRAHQTLEGYEIGDNIE